MPPHVAMKWARRLKRVYGIEIETCAGCGGKLRVIASLEEPAIIAKVLSHLERTACDREQPQLERLRPIGGRGGSGPFRPRRGEFPATGRQPSRAFWTRNWPLRRNDASPPLDIRPVIDPTGEPEAV